MEGTEGQEAGVSVETGEAAGAGAGEQVQEQGQGEAGPTVEELADQVAAHLTRIAELEGQVQASEARLEGFQAGTAEAVTTLIETARSLPDVIPEMVNGSTPAEVKASIEASREAFRQVAARIAPAVQAGAGGGARSGEGEQPAAASSDRGFNLILQGVTAGRNGGRFSR